MIVSALWLFLKVSYVGLQYAIVVFPDHTHLLSNNLLVKVRKIYSKNTVSNCKHQISSHIYTQQKSKEIVFEGL